MNRPSERPKRCCFHGCKSKIKLTDINCAYCDIYYCMKHRLPEQHNCSHDFKKVYEEQSECLANSMRCVAPKIDFISIS